MSPLSAMCAVAVIVVGMFSISAVVLPTEATAQQRQSKAAKYPTSCKKYTPGGLNRIKCDCAFAGGAGGGWLRDGNVGWLNGQVHADCVAKKMEIMKNRPVPSSRKRTNT